MPTSSWIVYLEKIIKVMTISIIWIPKYGLDTQIIFILKIENQLDAVTDWKVHSAGNKGVFREVEEFRFREKGKKSKLLSALFFALSICRMSFISKSDI